MRAWISGEQAIRGSTLGVLDVPARHIASDPDGVASVQARKYLQDDADNTVALQQVAIPRMPEGTGRSPRNVKSKFSAKTGAVGFGTRMPETATAGISVSLICRASYFPAQN